MRVEYFQELFSSDQPIAITDRRRTIKDYWYTDRILNYMDREVRAMSYDKDIGFLFYLEEVEER